MNSICLVSQLELTKDRIFEVLLVLVIFVSAARRAELSRTLRLPVDGRIIAKQDGLRVGKKVPVELISTDPVKGFIDCARRQ